MTFSVTATSDILFNVLGSKSIFFLPAQLDSVHFVHSQAPSTTAGSDLPALQTERKFIDMHVVITQSSRSA